MVYQQVEGPRVVEPHQMGQRSRAVISMNMVQIAGRAFITASLASPDAVDQPVPARPIDASDSKNRACDRTLQQQLLAGSEQAPPEVTGSGRRILIHPFPAGLAVDRSAGGEKKAANGRALAPQDSNQAAQALEVGRPVA